MALPNPILVREQKKHTREGFAQFLLASLLIGKAPQKWNTAYELSAYGSKALASVISMSFGESVNFKSGELFWEFRLDSSEHRGGRWPDLAFQTTGRLVLFELKTEAGSIREGQVGEYLQLAAAQFPELAVDMVYVTRDPVEGSPGLSERTRYVNLTWRQVADVLRKHSSELSNSDRGICRLFCDYLERALSPTSGQVSDVREPAEQIREELLTEDGDLRSGELFQILNRVERTQTQEALPLEVTSPNEAHRLSDRICEQIRWFNSVSKGEDLTRRAVGLANHNLRRHGKIPLRR